MVALSNFEGDRGARPLRGREVGCARGRGSVQEG